MNTVSLGGFISDQTYKAEYDRTVEFDGFGLKLLFSSTF